jgi:hypothetical protein
LTRFLPWGKRLLLACFLLASAAFFAAYSDAERPWGTYAESAEALRVCVAAGANAPAEATRARAVRRRAIVDLRALVRYAARHDFCASLVRRATCI